LKQSNLSDELIPEYLRNEIANETKSMLEEKEKKLENLKRIFVKVHEP